jgi:uncharacterized protein
MMKKIIPLILFALLLVCYPVMGLDLQGAKTQGLLGETESGYLGLVVKGAENQKLMDTINAKRKTLYMQISKRNKTALAEVEKLAGKKAIAKTPAGQFVKVKGVWKKK